MNMEAECGGCLSLTNACWTGVAPNFSRVYETDFKQLVFQQGQSYKYSTDLQNGPSAVFATRNAESPVTSEPFNDQPWWLDSYGIISSSALNHAAGRHRCQPPCLTSLLKYSSSRWPVKSAPHQKDRFTYRFVLTTRCRAERSVVWFHRWNLGHCKSQSLFFHFTWFLLCRQKSELKRNFCCCLSLSWLTHGSVQTKFSLDAGPAAGPLSPPGLHLVCAAMITDMSFVADYSFCLLFHRDESTVSLDNTICLRRSVRSLADYMSSLLTLEPTYSLLSPSAR